MKDNKNLKPEKIEIIEAIPEKNEITVKDFYAEWCGPCKLQTPIIKALEKEYEGKIKFEVIDVDKNEKIAGKYHISSIPTVVIEKDGVIVKRHIGVVSKITLKKELDKLLIS